MTLPHYQDRTYESCRQRRRYATDPAFRLDRINRTRQRAGLPPVESLEAVKLRRVEA